MSAKRKATQALLEEQQPRRSKRNAVETNFLQETKTSKVLNGNTKAIAKSTTSRQAKQPTKTIINDPVDFSKDVVPIRTYGKSDQTTISTSTRAASKLTATSKQTVESTRPAILANSSKTIKKKATEVVQKKTGNLTINSPASKVQTSTANNVHPITTFPQGLTVLETGGQKKIIINKIIMPPEAYNQMIKQQQASTTGKPVSNNNAAPATTITNQMPVQLLNNLVLSSGGGIKIITNPSLTVTNSAQPTTMLTTANLLPINQLNNKNVITTTSPIVNNQQQIAGGVKQLQLPITIIKSIVNPTQPTSTTTTVQATKSSPSKVNPISMVTRTPERVVVNIDSKNKVEKSRKTRVSFDVNKNTSTIIKPISSDLPITASNVLLTSTPKQSIIKKPKIFEPCTPICTPTSRRVGLNRAVANGKPFLPVLTVQQPPTATTTNSDQQQTKNKIESVQSNKKKDQKLNPVSIKYCTQSQCECWNLLSKDEIEKVKKVFASLNAPKQMLYIYCSTIKVNDHAKFDYEKFAFYVKTSTGFVQVCHRVYMSIFDKQNLSFVETAFKKCDI